jgi:hypothetical protein
MRPTEGLNTSVLFSSIRATPSPMSACPRPTIFTSCLHLRQSNRTASIESNLIYETRPGFGIRQCYEFPIRREGDVINPTIAACLNTRAFAADCPVRLGKAEESRRSKWNHRWRSVSCGYSTQALALLVGDNDFLFLHHCCGIVKQYFAAEITLLDHPIVTLPLFLA